MLLNFDNLVVKYFFFYVGKVLEYYVIGWYELYLNNENCLKLMSYIYDNIWVVDWWYIIKYEKSMLNRDHITSLSSEKLVREFIHACSQKIFNVLTHLDS